MGTVFRKQTTRPLPPGAEIIVRKGERLARWKDRKGKTRTAPLTVGTGGTDRIVTESPYFVAKYRDGTGVVRVVPTGCRDETAARQVLADLERFAGIAKRDDRGRVLDVHALRHTFGSLLRKGGVAPPDGTSCHASQQNRPDHERIHRPGTARRSGHP